MNEQDLLEKLAGAVERGRVAVRLDYRRLNHMDSPVCVEADYNRWIYGILVAVMGAGFGLGWPYAIVALAVGIGLYFGMGRRWLRRRMDARFRHATLFDLDAFKKLWRLNGVTLSLVDRPSLCRSPDGDWRRFVMVHLIAASGLDADTIA